MISTINTTNKPLMLTNITYRVEGVFMMSKSIFATLSFDAQRQHLTKIARRAVARWGYPDDSEIKLLNYTENGTFLITAKGYKPMIMRVHRLDYTTRASIRSELDWLAYLREHTDVKVETPIPAPDGNPIQAFDTPEMGERRFVVCFDYVPGRAPVDSADGNASVGNVISALNVVPKTITLPLFRVAARVQLVVSRWKVSKMTAADRQLYRVIGKTMATMHQAAQHWQRPAYFERMQWDLAGTIGAGNNFYGTDYHAPDWLSPRALHQIDDAVALIQEHVTAYGQSAQHYGMIHSDLRAANLLVDGKQLTVLDFDDSGLGYYMYDIASTVALMEHRGDLAEVVHELLSGYQSVRELSEQDKQMVWTFIMLRRIGMLQSLLSRMGHVMPGSGESQELTPEVLAFYAQGTAGLAKRYCREHAMPATQILHQEVRTR